MKSAYRACICYLAGKLILERGAVGKNMYDCHEDRRLDAAVLMEENNISLLEVRRAPGARPDGPGAGCALYNSLSGEIYFDISGKNKNKNGKTFRGYAAADSSLFMGTASGNLVIIYDYKEKSFFKYRFCPPENSRGPFPFSFCGALCRDCRAGKIRSGRPRGKR